MGGVRKVITTNIGTAYTLTLNIDMGTAEGLYIMPRTTNGGNIYTGTNLAQVYVTSSGTYSVNFTASTTTTQLLVEKAGAVAQTFYVDNVKVEQSTPTLSSYPIADVVNAQYYYPFGSTMKTWKADGEDYRFGFNGKEIDPEGIGGGGATYDYGFRIYNPYLGRFLSVDPLTMSYPWYTPYQFSGNSPIKFIDIDGLEQLDYMTYRSGMIRGAVALNNAPFASKPKSGTAYWNPTGTGFNMVKGQNPSAAIRHMVDNPSLYPIDCGNYVQIIKLYGMVASMGDAEFDRYITTVQNGKPFTILRHGSTGIGYDDVYKSTGNGMVMGLDGKKTNANKIVKNAQIGTEINLVSPFLEKQDDVMKMENIVKVGDDQYVAQGLNDGNPLSLKGVKEALVNRWVQNVNAIRKEQDQSPIELTDAQFNKKMDEIVIDEISTPSTTPQ